MQCGRHPYSGPANRVAASCLYYSNFHIYTDPYSNTFCRSNGSVVWYANCPTTTLQLTTHLDIALGLGIGSTTMRLRNSAGDYRDFAVPPLNYHSYADTYTTYCDMGPCVPSSWLTSLPLTLTVDYFDAVQEYNENNNDSWETSPPTPCGSVTPTPSPLLVGHVTWQGVTQPGTRNVMPISLILNLGSTEVDYSAQNTDARGYFTVSVSTLPNGTYTWRAKALQGIWPTPARFPFRAVQLRMLRLA